MFNSCLNEGKKPKEGKTYGTKNDSHHRDGQQEL